jgi:ABC-2 type transport system ATP-binding protein
MSDARGTVCESPVPVSVEDVEFAYGPQQVLRGVTLTAQPGRILGLLGPNGSGKTTLLHIVATLLCPQRGGVRFDGRLTTDDLDWARQRLCLVPQERAIDVLLTVQKNLKFYTLLEGVGHSRSAGLIARIAEELDLSPHLKKSIFQLSGGLMRRLQFATVLVSRAPVLLLDEPTIGVDPNGKRRLWSIIRRQATECGRTVILATNDMTEADELCDRIMFLRDGRVVAVDSPERLKALTTGTVVRFETVAPPARVPDLSGVEGLIEVRLLDDALEVSFASLGENLGRTITAVMDDGHVIRSINVRPPSLDDAFAALVRRNGL